jgi:hypothetical protein
VSSNMIAANIIFGPAARNYVEPLRALCLELSGTRYHFLDNTEFQAVMVADSAKGAAIYWHEILGRSHLAASVGIARSLAWIRGMITAHESENLLAFSATFRGLLESAADTYYTVRHVPQTLAQLSEQIVRALNGKMCDQVLVCSELEDALVHFSHARKTTKSEKAFENQRAKTAQQYLQLLEAADISQVKECYGELCEYSHASARSVAYLMKELEPTFLEFDCSADITFISDMCRRYNSMMMPLLMFAFNGCLVTLKVLNHFPAREFHSMCIQNWNLDAIGSWRKCKNALPPPHALFGIVSSDDDA